jgi:hypothetical protein
MAERFSHFGGIDFSGAREPLSNLWTAIGREHNGRLRILSVRPHAYRADLAAYVTGGWRTGLGDDDPTSLWGVDFPFGLPDGVAKTLGCGTTWPQVVAWVADRTPEEVRAAAGDTARSMRTADTPGALAPLDIRLYKQTVEGFKWLQLLHEEHQVSICPQAVQPESRVTLIEVYPSNTAQELGMPRRRAPGRAGEIRARAAALRTFVDFDTPDVEALVVALEDAWDAMIACLTSYLCRDDLEQPFRAGKSSRETIETEGWIYRPPVTVT